MIEEIAQVAAVGEGTIQVVTQRQTSCGECADRQVCSSSVLARLFSPHQVEMTLTNSLDLHPGDRVVIGVPENGFLTSTLMLYGLPIFAMLFFGMLGHWVGGILSVHQDLASILFGFGGLFGVFYTLMKTSFGQSQLNLKPTVLRKAPTAL